MRLALEILATYPRAWWLIRRRPLPAVLGRLRRSRTPRPIDDAQQLRSRQLGHAVTRTLTPLPLDSRCLIRSLVLVRVLDRRHIPTRVIIGVKPGGEDLAHAWVEVGGPPVLDPGDYFEDRLREV